MSLFNPASSASAKTNWPGYSTTQVIAASGATYRQLDYWARTGCVSLLHEAQGSGSSRRWSLANACEAAALFRSSECGVQPSRIAGAITPWPTDGGYLVIVPGGKGVVLPTAQALVAEVLQGCTQPFIVLDLGAIESELRSRLDSLTERAS